MMTIAISEVPKALELNFGANRPVQILGASGVGKTETAVKYAEMQGPDYALLELNAATANLPDLMGVLMPGQEKWPDADGNIVELTTGSYAYPYWARDKRSGVPGFCFKRGLIVIEEYGQATGDVKRALASLIWEKRVGKWRFDGFDILLLANRPQDRSGVTKDFDFIINRLVILEAKAELDGWLVWAHDHGVTNTALAYAHRNEGKVFANKAPEKQGPWMTPRSLVTADEQVKSGLAMGVKLDDMFMWENLAGSVGEGLATEYIAFAKIRDKLPTISAILANPSTCQLPAEMDQQIFLVFDLASKANKDNVANIITYINRMPADFSIAFYRSAMQRDTALRSTRAFGDWAVKNVGLLSAISSAR
jgi:hypothetical protein